MTLRGDDYLRELLDTFPVNSISTSSIADENVNEEDSGDMSSYETLIGAFTLSPPSNPHVEIIRHRCYEKFKSKFYDTFRSCVSHGGKTAKKNSASSLTVNEQESHYNYIRTVICRIWNHLTPHNILERYHFSLKTLEAECIREVQGQVAREESEKWVPSWCKLVHHNGVRTQDDVVEQLLCPTVHQIYHWICDGKASGTSWEPLLPVPSICTNRSKENVSMQKVNYDYSKKSLMLLVTEIKFQFRRTFSQQCKSGGNHFRSSKKELQPLHLDELFFTLQSLSDGTHIKEINCTSSDAKADNHQSKSKRVLKQDKQRLRINDDAKNSKEEIVLQKLFDSKPFNDLVRAFHRKLLFIFEECYFNFITELKKCSTQLSFQDRNHQKSGTKKRVRNHHLQTSCIPKISFIDSDEDFCNSFRQATVSFGGISLTINEFHMSKLKFLFQQLMVHIFRSNESYQNACKHFSQVLFTILLRYDGLEGAGLQSAIPSTVFRFLNKRYGNIWECFASPFNCWVEKRKANDPRINSNVLVAGGEYGCAFGDTDAWFGGVGSFFQLDILTLVKKYNGGCFQANPPFASDFIQAMCDRIHQIFSHECISPNNESTKDTVPLMFIIFLPSWKESSCWNSLISSPYLTKHIILYQKKNPHFYAEGTQYRRLTKDLNHEKFSLEEKKNFMKASHRCASIDTSVFYFQNTAAQLKWPLSEDDEVQLKSAFAFDFGEKFDMDLCQRDLSIERPQAQHIFSRKDHKNKVPPTSKLCPAASNTLKKRKIKLMSGGKDEISILASLGILEEPSQNRRSHTD